MTITAGLRGFIADREDFCGDGHVCDSGLLGAAPSSLPSRFILDKRGPEILQTANDCVSVALAVAMRDRMLAQGTVDAALPAARRIYLHARLIAVANEYNFAGTTAQRIASAMNAAITSPVPLADEGSVPEFALAAINEVGWCSAQWWPYESTTANDLSGPIAAEQHAYDQRGKLKAHVWSAVDEAKSLLFGGVTLAIGGVIDRAYEDPPSTGSVWHYSGAPLGGHMRRVIGWDDALGAFIEAGSWGDGLRYTAFDDIVNPDVTSARFALDWVPSLSEDNPLAGSINHVALRRLPGPVRRGMPPEPAARTEWRRLPRRLFSRGRSHEGRPVASGGHGHSCQREMRRLALLGAGVVGAVAMPCARCGR